jgi:phage gpG-like protein
VSDAGVHVDGLDDAVRDIARWADQLGGVIARVADPVAQRAAQVVRSKVPRLSGQLAGSVGVVDSADGAELVMGGPGVPYAAWIEFGGKRGRPYIAEGRYLYPTAQDFEDDFVQAAEGAADDSVRRFPWSTPPST